MSGQEPTRHLQDADHGTAVGGCSFMIHVRHAAAAIAAGLCETVLITHRESGRSGVGRTPQCGVAGEPCRPVRAA
jgi:hypothetical protein